MHTGLDFRAEYGAPVRASGAGQVVGAEYAGAYGRMVEIDHGNGVTTRYAHLSSFAVSPGQSVAAGTVIGRAGSTGRSTGAHLHYETRIDGEAIDPQRFLRAGSRLALSEQSVR
jgi:murein DD-endopeptidase MepM/ murein hydrolase activator NlpD